MTMTMMMMTMRMIKILPIANHFYEFSEGIQTEIKKKTK